MADVLDAGGTEALDAMVHAVDDRARCVKTGRRRWVVETGGQSRRASKEVALTRFSTGAEFAFEDRS